MRAVHPSCNLSFAIARVADSTVSVTEFEIHRVGFPVPHHGRIALDVVEVGLEAHGGVGLVVAGFVNDFPGGAVVAVVAAGRRSTPSRRCGRARRSSHFLLADEVRDHHAVEVAAGHGLLDGGLGMAAGVREVGVAGLRDHSGAWRAR